MRIDLAGFSRDERMGDHRALMALVERADTLGFGGIWFNEFHFQREAIPYPSTLILGAEILARTQRLRFGTSILVLPLYHPLLLAEQIAQLDFQSHGRVDIGIGRGTDPQTLKALELAPEDARTRFSEALAIMLAAWKDETVCANGPTWRFESVGVGPPVVQKPHPPIYVAGVSRETIDLAAANGFPLLLSLEPNENRQLPEFVKALDRHGGNKDALKASSLSRYVVIAPRRAEAEERLEVLTDLLNKRRANLARRRGTPPPHPRSQQQMIDGYTIFGTPQMCVEQIRALRRDTGVQALRCLFSGNSMLGNDVALAAMECFAAEVLPALSDQTIEA